MKIIINSPRKKYVLFFLLFCNQLLSQNNIPGTWEGIMHNNSTTTEKKISINVILPNLSKTHKCGYEETLVKAFFKEEEKEVLIEYDGILSFDCYSINLYSQELYGKDFSYFKGFLYRNNYDNYEDLLPITYTTMQLILKKENPHGYWQKVIKNADFSTTVLESGKILFKKHTRLKRA